jgi:hypothetical protein
VEEFKLEHVNDEAFKEHDQIKISNRFSALENVYGEDVDIRDVWGIITENMKVSATESRPWYELKQQIHGLMKSTHKY